MHQLTWTATPWSIRRSLRLRSESNPPQKSCQLVMNTPGNNADRRPARTLQMPLNTYPGGSCCKPHLPPPPCTCLLYMPCMPRRRGL